MSGEANQDAVLSRVRLTEERVNRMEAIQLKMSEDIHKVAIAVTQLVEDRSALKRAFALIDRLNGEVARIAAKIEEAERARLQEQLATSAKALDEERTAKHKEEAESKRRRQTLVMDFLRLVMAAAVGAVLVHFGIPVVHAATLVVGG